MKFPWPLSMTAPLIAVATTVCLLALILSTNLGGYGVGNVFAYHPALMTVGFCFFMPLGLLGYVYDLGSAGNAVYSGRTQRRVLHGIFMMCASCCILTAYLAAFVYHQARGIDHLALNMPEKTRPAHVFLGFIALAGECMASSRHAAAEASCRGDQPAAAAADQAPQHLPSTPHSPPVGMSHRRHLCRYDPVRGSL